MDKVIKSSATDDKKAEILANIIKQNIIIPSITNDELNTLKVTYIDNKNPSSNVSFKLEANSQTSEKITLNNSTLVGTNTGDYLFIQNLPPNVKDYNIKITDARANYKEGSITVKVQFLQYFMKVKESDTPGSKPTEVIKYFPNSSSPDDDIFEANFIIKGFQPINAPTNIFGTDSFIGVGDKGIITLPPPPTTTTKADPTTPTTLDAGSLSMDIIKKILRGRVYANKTEDEDVTAKIQTINDLNSDDIQPNVLDDVEMRMFVYAALAESGGSPHSLSKNDQSSIVYQDGEAGNEYYVLKDVDALKNFITWKINPSANLLAGTLTLSPLINLWFSEDTDGSLKLQNRYMPFGVGKDGIPTIVGDVASAPTNTSIVLTGFAHPKTAELTFANAVKPDAGTTPAENPKIPVYDGTVRITLSGNTNVTAKQFVNQEDWFSTINKGITVSDTGIVWVKNKDGDIVKPSGDSSDSKFYSLANLCGTDSPNGEGIKYTINQFNGTIEIQTQTMRYFDAYNLLREGPITIVIAGFLSAGNAYQTTYIIIITTIIALIVILAIVLARMLWVKYSKSRDEYNQR